MPDMIIKARELLAQGQLAGAEECLVFHLADATGVERAERLMLLTTIAQERQDWPSFAWHAYNAAAALVNAGYLADAAHWIAVHLERLPGDVRLRLLYRDVLRHLASSTVDQSEVFQKLADDLELEQCFLRMASPHAVIDWWQQLPQDAARPHVVREICQVLPTLSPSVAVPLFRLMEPEIPPDLVLGVEANVALMALLSPEPDCLLHRRLMERWSATELQTKRTGMRPLIAPVADRKTRERLRIGFVDLTYLSLMPNYRDVLLAPSWRALADGAADVFVYIYPWVGATVRPDLRDIVPAGVTGRWIESFQTIAQSIAADDLDVLLLTNGYLINMPVQIFAARPAYRMALWLHTFGTYGPDLFDGMVIDEHSYSDTHAQMSFEPPVGREGFPVLIGPSAVAPPIRPLPALDNGYITFGALARPHKFGSESYRLWASVVMSLPNARLCIHGTGMMDDASIQKLLTDLAAFGVPAERIDLAPYIDDHRDYLDAIGRIDIVLDAFPFNGGLTTFEALWQGVPVVSRYGEAPLSRSGLLYLTEAGLPELVAKDEREYQHIALTLAKDCERLVTMRRTLRDHLLRSRLMDAAAFRHRFHRAMEQLLALPARGCPG